jgi:heme exporter protein B
LFKFTLIILEKELRQEFVSKFMLNSMLMFSVLLIFIVAFPFAEYTVELSTKVILFWVVIYFATTTGLSSTFQKECDKQTIPYLKINFPAQSIYWGKTLFNFISLLFVAFCVLILYSSFFQFEALFDYRIMCYLFLSLIGLAANGTLLSALIAQTSSSGVLYAIIGFPVLFPFFLLGIDGMTAIISSIEFDVMLWVSVAVYDFIALALGYLLFDSIWEVI